ncbi:MAG: hypothetical protein N4A63_11200 [Vallitalea sp.]|nr:hypothetical protein [Vallitalea sp.]
MNKAKKFISLVLLGCILFFIIFIIYIIYFEFIYTSNIINYFNINPKNVEKILITEYNFDDSLDNNKLSSSELTNKKDIIKFMSNLGNHTIKRKVYQDFKSKHKNSVMTRCSTSKCYQIIIILPDIIYTLDIGGGRSIIASTHKRANYIKVGDDKFFEFMGKPYVNNM